jgi:hypothetical protein
VRKVIGGVTSEDLDNVPCKQVEVNQSPEGSRRLRFPDFKTIGT